MTPSKVSFVVLAALLLLAGFYSEAEAQPWTPVGPPGNPSVTALLVDPISPTTVYAGTSGNGVFVTTDAGATWSNSTAGLTSLSVTSLAARQPSTLVISPFLCTGTNGGGVFKSSDRGLTWVAVNNGLGNLTVSVLAITSIGTVYVGTSGGGIFRSTDDAASWIAINTGLTDLNIASLSVNPSNPSILLASTFGGGFRTTDGGANWSFLLDRVFATAWDPFVAGTAYAGFGFTGPSRLNGGLLKTTDGGEHWFPSDAGLGHQIINTVAVDPTTPGRVFAGTGSSGFQRGFFVTSDYGTSWSAAPADGLPIAGNELPVLAPASPPVAYLGTVYGVYRTNLEGNCAIPGPSLCLTASRFVVSASWRISSPFATLASAVPLTSNTGAFWFFDPTNLELVVKVLDGRSVNGKWWVFYGALSNVEYTITVTDTQTDAVKTYFNPQGQLASVADTGAFP